MLEPLYIEKTDDSPKVILDQQKGVFLIEGMSMPEETALFYSQIYDWLEKYVSNPNEYTEFVFKLYYYNSTSSIEFVKIIKLLDKLHQNNKKVKVIWYYRALDETIKEDGEEFKKYFNLEIELKELK